ncbi:MAG TPA: HAD hydrolase family protein [Nocardioides sp.]|uniref:HAD family hydrolase n=1 Tax=Nocardioides sp. TaxID=35761 RepID=UPI002E2FA680|nr:HAD hydrolase family protein [Nocardioides sp.]HEX3929767.1 HAD hydrolase family protein [Nocardioides sp.]
MTGLKLVATDLDGTLLDGAGELGEYTQRVLRQVQEQGVRVVVVTARPLRRMESLWPRVGGDRGIGIVSNGAVTYDIGRREVVESHGICAEAGLPLAALVRAAVPGTAFGLEVLSGYRHEPGYVDLHPTPPDMRVGDLTELWDEPAVKLLAQHLTMDPVEFRSRVTDAVGDLATPTWTTDPPRGGARGGRGLRGHAQRHPDARLGRPVVRRGERARERARGRGRAGAGQRRGGGGADARPAVRPGSWPCDVMVG